MSILNKDSKPDPVPPNSPAPQKVKREDLTEILRSVGALFGAAGIIEDGSELIAVAAGTIAEAVSNYHTVAVCLQEGRSLVEGDREYFDLLTDMLRGRDVLPGGSHGKE